MGSGAAEGVAKAPFGTAVVVVVVVAVVAVVALLLWVRCCRCTAGCPLGVAAGFWHAGGCTRAGAEAEAEREAAGDTGDGEEGRSREQGPAQAPSLGVVPEVLYAVG